MLTMAPVLLIILFTCLIFEQSHGLGHVAVRLRSYDNEAGELDNGHCCDGKWGICSSKCDYYFHICLDAPDGSPSLEECAIGSEVTDHLHNEDNIDFTDEIGDTPNPIVFDFTEWPVPLDEDMLSFKMKIDVWDADSVGDDDFVDYFSEHVSTFPDPVNTQVYLLSKRTSLMVEVRLWCEEDWYGLNCSVYCSPPDEDAPGHYDCSHDGDKICHPGWTGPDCTEDIQECASDPCQNGATCVDNINNFHCECPDGYTGVFCETITDPCVLEPCLNGASCQAISDIHYNCVCEEDWYGLNCSVYCSPSDDHYLGHYDCSHDGDKICHPGWTGPDCTEDIQECDSDLLYLICQNGATCVDGINNFHCVCPDGYTGVVCGTITDPCVLEPCLNGASCQAISDVHYNCICEEDWYGLHCSVYCSPQDDYYLGHYDCSQDGDKICHPGWTGADCTEDIDECASDPCHYGATCVDYINNFLCECPDGYYDVFCDTITDLCVLEPCFNGAFCQAISDIHYNCVCMLGFTGRRCETDVSECEEESCLNGGSCIDGINSYTCLCPPGYTGLRCQGETSGNGHISVNLVSYDNEESRTDNGRFCDAMLGFKQSECDHYFTICLDDVYGDNSMENCVLGTATTRTVWNRDVIVFTDDIGGTPNPILFSGTFSRLTGDMRIKVEVWDSDNIGQDDFVDFLTETVSVVTGLREEDANVTAVIMQGRTRLVALVKAWCADDWYGEDCSVYCSLEDVDFGDLLQDGGYECNEDGELTFIPAIFGGEEYYP